MAARHIDADLGQAKKNDRTVIRIQLFAGDPSECAILHYATVACSNSTRDSDIGR